MLTYSPRVGQWAIYGPELKVGKITAKTSQYNWPGQHTGPVKDVMIDGNWYFVEKVKIIRPSEARKLTRNSILAKTDRPE